MREFRPYGSVRAVLGNWHPYRDVCSGEAGQAAVDVVAILVKHEFQSTAGRLDARLPHEVLARLKRAAEFKDVRSPTLSWLLLTRRHVAP
jgi:hypothetical protein